MKLTFFIRNSCFCTETSSSQCSKQTKHPQPGLKPRLQEISAGVYFPTKKKKSSEQKNIRLSKNSTDSAVQCKESSGTSMQYKNRSWTKARTALVSCLFKKLNLPPFSLLKPSLLQLKKSLPSVGAGNLSIWLQ